MTHRNLISRRTLMRGAAASAALGLTPARAQNAINWPDHTVRMIVPYPAGGSTDVLFRMISERFKEKLGQNFVVENKPGASGNIGIDMVAKGPPDGHTIGGATVGHFSINQFLIAKMPFDAEKDLVAPSLTYELPNVAVVATQHVPAKTLQEFIAWAKARPNGISIGSPGPGTTPHLSGVLFAARTGVNAVHVPFRGAAQTIPAMLSGDVTFAVDNLASYISQIRIRSNARARRHLVAALAYIVGCADDGGGWRQGLHRHVMGRLCDGRGNSARHRQQAIRRAQGDHG